MVVCDHSDQQYARHCAHPDDNQWSCHPTIPLSRAQELCRQKWRRFVGIPGQTAVRSIDVLAGCLPAILLGGGKVH